MVKGNNVNIHKVCPCCEHIFYKPTNLSLNEWGNRIWCSNKCSKIKYPIEQYIKIRLDYIFSKTITTESGCIEWQGHCNQAGYGRIVFLGKRVLITHLIWELKNEEMPNNFNVLHTCDNPPCINIEHLFLGTHKTNYHDMISKGRQNHYQKLSNNEMVDIIQLIKEGVSYQSISLKFKVSRRHINHIALQKGI